MVPKSNPQTAHFKKGSNSFYFKTTVQDKLVYGLTNRHFTPPENFSISNDSNIKASPSTIFRSPEKKKLAGKKERPITFYNREFNGRKKESAANRKTY